MKRFRIPAIFNPQEDDTGSYVLYADVVEAMQASLMFAASHSEDINNGVNDFGELKPVLDIIQKDRTVN